MKESIICQDVPSYCFSTSLQRWWVLGGVTVTVTKYVVIPNMWHSRSTKCALHTSLSWREVFFLTICHLVVYFSIFSINLLHLNLRTVQRTIFNLHGRFFGRKLNSGQELTEDVINNTITSTTWKLFVNEHRENSPVSGAWCVNSLRASGIMGTRCTLSCEVKSCFFQMLPGNSA